MTTRRSHSSEDTILVGCDQDLYPCVPHLRHTNEVEEFGPENAGSQS